MRKTNDTQQAAEVLVVVNEGVAVRSRYQLPSLSVRECSPVKPKPVGRRLLSMVMMMLSV